MKLLSCEVCKSIKLSFFSKKDNFILLKCLKCSFVFVSNPPTKKQLNNFYKNKDYENPIFAEIRIRSEAKHSIKLINKFCTKQNSLLDIGCGRGYFLDEARKKKWSVSGIDYSKNAIKFATEKLNLKVTKSDIFSYRPKKKYSIVTLNQVIEHISEADELIKKISTVLNKNGILYIATPNISSLSAKILKNKFDYLIPPEHLSYFNSKSLEYLLNNNGYKVLYSGTWSYSAELAGILKSLVKKNSNENVSEYRKNEQKINKYNKNSSITNIKILLFDTLFCSLLHPLLDILKSGSIIEIVAKKND